MRRPALFALSALLLVVASTASAQEMAVDNIYGAGVQAWYGGDYSRAFELLTQAVAADTQDPRVYYFRGLSTMYLGGDPASDFAAGAKLEASDAGGYDIGRSLERVQGSSRLLLERYRAQARLQAAQARDQERVRRYNATAPAAAAPVPRAPMGKEPAAPAQPKVPAAPPAGKAPDDPFAPPPPAAKPAAPADDPFAPPK